MHVERLSDQRDLTQFRCGVKALDDWLCNHAVENMERRLTTTYLLISDEGDVAGYFSLTMGGVRRDELPRRYARGLPRFALGVALLARFAISEQLQGLGYGRDLLVEAIRTAAGASAIAAARFIAVDPIDESARRFYAQFGFLDVQGDAGGRMYLRVDHALEALAELEQGGAID